VALVYHIVWAMPLIAVVLALRQRRQWDPAALLIVAAAAAMQVLMNYTMLRDPLVTRIRDVIAPAVVLLAFVVAVAWRRHPGWTAARRASAVTLVLVMALATVQVGATGEKLRETGVHRGWPGLVERWHELHAQLAPPDDRVGYVAREYREIVAYLERCTPAGARLFAVGFLPELFFNTGRGFAGGHVLYTPGYYLTDRHASQTLDRLARQDVPFVVTDSETWPEMRQQYARVAAHVGERYREAARFTVARRDLVVWADAGRPSVAGYGDQQWPCFAAGSAVEAAPR
jgi:hypothetical protein